MARAFYSVPLVYVPVFMPVPGCFDDSGLVIQFDISWDYTLRALKHQSFLISLLLKHLSVCTCQMYGDLMNFFSLGGQWS